MREGRFRRVFASRHESLSPLLATAELKQSHIKSVNAPYQWQDPLMDNSREQSAEKTSHVDSASSSFPE